MSDRANFTPGPWHALHRMVNDESGHAVAMMNLAIPTDRARADARLIAAAPNMLAALEEALEFIADREDVIDGDYGIPEPNLAMQVAATLRAAIARATGVAP